MKLNDGIVTWPIISMEPRVLHTEFKLCKRQALSLVKLNLVSEAT